MKTAWIVTLAGACCLLVSSAARAQTTTYQDTATLGIGINDNPRALPRGTVDPPREPDAFLMARNSFTLDWQRASTTHQLNYSVAASRYFQETQASTITNAIALNNNFTLKPPLILSLGVSGMHGIVVAGALPPSLQVQTPSTPTGAPMPAPSPSGFSVAPSDRYSFVSTSARQGLTWEIDARWRFAQALTTTYYFPLSNETILRRTLTTVLDAGLDYQVGRNLWAVYTQLGHTHRFATTDAAGMRVAALDPQFATLGGTYQRSFTEWLSASVSAGVLAFRSTFGSSVDLSPAGSAAARYAGPSLTVGVTVERTARPAAALGEVFISDGARGDLGWRIDQLGHYYASASGGYYRGQTLTAREQGISPITFRTGTLSFRYRPWLLREVNFLLEYVGTLQDGGSLGNMVELPGVRRNILMLSVSIGIPFVPRAL